MTGHASLSLGDAASIAGLLERQHEVLTTLAGLSSRQDGLIDSEDDDGLLGLLAERQVLVDDLATLGERLRAFRADWDRRLALMPAADRDQVVRRWELVAALAGAQARRDEAFRQRLAARRDELADELAALTAGRGAISAYLAPAPTGPTYQDREA